MSAIGTGSSSKSNSVQAVEEALQQARMKVQGLVDWGLIFFSAEHLDHAEKIRQILVENTPGTQWTGCSAGGVLSENGEKKALQGEFPKYKRHQCFSKKTRNRLQFTRYFKRKRIGGNFRSRCYYQWYYNPKRSAIQGSHQIV